jgi:hypothetical protein
MLLRPHAGAPRRQRTAHALSSRPTSVANILAPNAQVITSAAICLTHGAGAADNEFMLLKARVTVQRTLAVVIVLLLCAPTGNINAAQASDFGFRFEFAPCGPLVTERLDTFNGVFTANLGGQDRRRVAESAATVTLVGLHHSLRKPRPTEPVWSMRKDGTQSDCALLGHGEYE